MITVKDMLDYALEIDLSHLAHSIYWAMLHHKISLDDDSELLKAIEYNDEEVQRMMEQNVLDVGRVKLFVMDTENDWYAFYLAEHSLDAYRLHEKLFRQPRHKLTRADRLMIKRMTFADTGAEESLCDYKKEVLVYPAYVGHAKAGERVLYRMEVGA